jgi:hypothetical protein
VSVEYDLAARKLSRPFTTFNAVCLVGALVLFGLLWSVGWPTQYILLVVVPMLLLSIPPLLGSVPERISKYGIAAKIQFLQKKVFRALPLPGAKGRKKLRSIFDEVEFLSASVPDRGRMTSLGISATKRHWTVYLKVTGHSRWAVADPVDKAAIDKMIIGAVAKAGDETRQKLTIVPLRMQRPSDPTQHAQNNRVRLRQEMLAAAIPGATGSTERRQDQASNAMSGASLAINGGNKLTCVFAVRMPKQRLRAKLRRAKDVSDPEQFKRSHLYRTLQTLMSELIAAGVEGVSPMSLFQVATTLGEGYRVALIQSWYRRQQRDRELRMTKAISSLEESPIVKEGPFPTSGSGNSSREGYLHYDGSFFAIGFLKKIRAETLPPGFMQRALAMPFMAYIFANWIDLPLARMESRRAKEKQRLSRMRKELNSLDRNLDDPEYEAEKRRIRRRREQLASASSRAAAWLPVISVGGSSVEEVEDRWAVVEQKFGAYFDIERLTLVPDMEQAFLGQFGIVPE